ncbi:hypothetical protein [Oceanobacillus kimchii]|uniref:hypothetical protein n=1 Tax=Oceanobacillus kimchii TaxID=746691 RepID=UPI003B011300
MKNDQLYVNEVLCGDLGVEVGEHKLLLSFLTRNEKDLGLFMDKYYNGNVVKNMIVFQRHKREINKMSQDEFGIMFEENEVAALEKLFQEQVSERDIERMNKQTLTYEEIYKRHTKHPHESLNNVLKDNLVKTTKRDDSYLIQF